MNRADSLALVAVVRAHENLQDVVGMASRRVERAEAELANAKESLLRAEFTERQYVEDAKALGADLDD